MWLRTGGGQESLVYCNIFVQAARCNTGVLGGSGSGGHGGGGTKVMILVPEDVFPGFMQQSICFLKTWS